jgi:hypothetical protein
VKYLDICSLFVIEVLKGDSDYGTVLIQLAFNLVKWRNAFGCRGRTEMKIKNLQNSKVRLLTSEAI